MLKVLSEQGNLGTEEVGPHEEWGAGVDRDNAMEGKLVRSGWSVVS